MRILVTGGTGFIPSSLADELVKNKNQRVTLIDTYLTGTREKITIANKYDDLAPIMTSKPFDYVFHYAAMV